jgi:SOS-response transcriptional repressor LexA
MEEDLQDLAGSDGVSIHTGFPNPALDRRGQGAGKLTLDINQLLIQHPSSTYLFRIAGHQWSDQGVYDGDVAVVDRATRRQPGDLVIAWQASGFVIARQRQLAKHEEIWGVITAIIHQFARS